MQKSMKEKIQPQNSLFHLVIKIPKTDSAFVYFTLEAGDGTGFYSTLDHEIGQAYREIDIWGDMTCLPEMEYLLQSLQHQQVKWDLLLKETNVADGIALNLAAFL